MARTPAPPPSVPLALNQPRSETARKLQERIDAGEELRMRQVRSAQEGKEYEQQATAWSDYNEELLKRLFTNDSISQEFRMGGGPLLGQYDQSNMHELFRESTENHVGVLRSVLGRLDLFPEPAAQNAITRHAVQQRDLSKVFVVHGHDEGAREAVARFLERLGIQPIILHEQASQGRTVIEKVEAHGDVGFAVILLTPDDMGCVRGGTPAPRARQNVVLELGYFIGRLGRKYVCALKRGEVEIPSDFGGVVYETYDEGGGWKRALGRELQGAGFEIDWNVVMR